MPSLLEALSDGSFDLLTKKDTSSDFSRKLQAYKDIIVSEYLKFNIDLNRAIAKIAEKNNLNDDQIQRIVEEVNNQVYLVKYNRMKNSPDRDVEFDIASVPKIKEIIGKGEAKKSAYVSGEKSANNADGSLEKKASWETDEATEKLNFLNYSTHEFAGLSPEIVRSKDSLLAEKIASVIKFKEKAFKDATEKIAADTYSVAEAFIKYDRFGLDTQNIFEEVCKEANIVKADQLMFKNAVIQKVAQMKEYKQLPQEYDLKLELCECEKTANEFSLGKYSFIKEATETTQSNKNVPVVTTDRKVIKNVNDLISMAKNIQKDKDDTKKQVEELKAIKEKTANISMSELEKLAASGIASFGKAFLGIGKKTAGKELSSATSHLGEILNNEGLVNAKKTVSYLEQAAKDVSGHSRMNDVKQGLDSAQDNLNNIRVKHDRALNNAAAKNPISRMFDSDYRDAKSEIKQAKNQVGKAQQKYDAQKGRLQGEIGEQLNQAKRHESDIGAELGVNIAKQKAEDAQKAFNKATRATRSARTITAVGVGAPAAAMAVKKKQGQPGPYTYANNDLQ
jgi:hypothetical protein